jgi:hypothetical protein
MDITIPSDETPHIIRRISNRLLRGSVTVGKVVLPLHGSADGKPEAQMLHHMAMQEMAGTNWQGQPRGFRIAPTSRKNPTTHRPGPSTRLEALARAASKGAKA